MGNTYQDVIDLAFGELDLQNDELETKLKALLTEDARTLAAAQVVDSEKGDTDVSGFLSGFKTIARVVGKTSTPLTDDVIAEVQNAISEIVDVRDQPLLTGALEQLFAGYLGIIRTAKDFKTYIETPPPGE